jgi:hypothetical protein
LRTGCEIRSSEVRSQELHNGMTTYSLRLTIHPVNVINIQLCHYRIDAAFSSGYHFLLTSDF